MTRGEALTKHREMWTAMQKELGDNPSDAERADFKRNWCLTHNTELLSDCFLCQYVSEILGSSHIKSKDCEALCPIDWGYDAHFGRSNCVFGATDYLTSPISEILALPERVVSNEETKKDTNG